MKDINFFEGTKKGTPQKKAASAIKICVIVLIAVIILIGGVYAALYIQGRNLSKDISEAKQQIEQIQQDNSGVSLIDSKKKKLEALIAYAKQAQDFHTSVNDYPQFDSGFLLHIYRRLPSDAKIVSMEYKDGILKLTCQARNSLSPAAYADQLKTHRMIEKVNYSGNYIVSEEDNTLQFIVECMIRGER